MSVSQASPSPAVSGTGGLLGQGSIRERVVDALSRVRATSPEEFEREITNAGGDLEIDSKQAEAAIGRLRHELGRALPGPKDLEPEQCNSVDALVRLVEHSIQSAAQT